MRLILNDIELAGYNEQEKKYYEKVIELSDDSLDGTYNYYTMLLNNKLKGLEREKREPSDVEKETIKNWNNYLDQIKKYLDENDISYQIVISDNGNEKLVFNGRTR